MDRLEQRILWALDRRKITQRGWAMAAGLSPSYLGTTLTRLRRDPSHRPDHDSLVKLARAARVSVRWLEDGEGSPEAEPAEPTEAEGAVVLVRDADVLEEALGRAWRATGYPLETLDATRRVARATYRMSVPGADVERMARAWLDAAQRLRRLGAEVNAGTLLQALCAPASPESETRANAEGDERARSMGLEPGSSADALERLRKPRK